MNKQIKPNCILIGAAKSGTTFLYKLLSQHTDICVPKAKEMTFFTNDKRYINHVKFLKHQYSHYTNEKIILDNTPEYLLKSYCAKRIHEFSGESTKLICILRNPVTRAFSHYKMLVNSSLENQSFYEAIKDEIEMINYGRPTYRPFKRVARDYIKRGLYYESLSEFFKYFSKKNIHIIIFEDFINDPQKVLNKLILFLEIKNYFQFNFKTSKNQYIYTKPTFYNRFIYIFIHLMKKLKINITHDTLIKIRKFTNKISYGEKPELDDISKKYLTNYFKQSIIDLEKLINKDLSIWY